MATSAACTHGDLILSAPPRAAAAPSPAVLPASVASAVPPPLPVAKRTAKGTGSQPSESIIRRRKSRPVTLVAGKRMGPWRVEGELGRGGMAAVYAVTHTRFGKRAALKLAHPSILSPSFTPETFLREARIVHLVDHPGAPDVFATGSYDGRPYLAMERLSGRTLGELVDDRAISRDEGIAILLEVCDILAAAHAAGVVHRDLKLDNVFVRASGERRVKLLDWGVARVLAEPDPLKGMIAGTLTYVAPEQITGDDLTPAADIYSLGVLAYHVLLGAPPFSGSSDLELIKKHVHERPPTPASRWPEIPDSLARVLTAMLAKDPRSRPSLDAIASALEDARRALVPKRQHPLLRALLGRRSRTSRPSRLRVAIGATLFAVGALGAAATLIVS
jgi:eukaryotic-like serine/threonine-protein kinase